MPTGIIAGICEFPADARVRMPKGSVSQKVPRKGSTRGSYDQCDPRPGGDVGAIAFYLLHRRPSRRDIRDGARHVWRVGHHFPLRSARGCRARHQRRCGRHRHGLGNVKLSGWTFPFAKTTFNEVMVSTDGFLTVGTGKQVCGCTASLGSDTTCNASNDPEDPYEDWELRLLPATSTRPPSTRSAANYICQPEASPPSFPSTGLIMPTISRL